MTRNKKRRLRVLRRQCWAFLRGLRRVESPIRIPDKFEVELVAGSDVRAGAMVKLTELGLVAPA